MKEGDFVTFQTEGNPNGNKVLLIHAMFVSADSFSAMIEYLKDDYYIILPTLDGHDVNSDSTFSSIEDEADKIIAYLQQNNIGKLDFILGTSLGAIIAFEIYKRNAVKIDKVYLDGGPFFNLKLLQKIGAKQLWNICTKTRKDPQSTVKEFETVFPSLGNMMADVCSHMTEQSSINLAHACYSFKLPQLIESEQRKVVFLYGTKEPARMCIFKLKRYKYSRIIKKIDYNHCGFLLSNPKEYADMLKSR